MTAPAVLSDEERVALWRAFSNGEDLPWLPQGPQDAHWTAAVDRMLAALTVAGWVPASDVQADSQRLHAELDNARHQHRAVQNQVDSLVREMKRLTAVQRMASRHASQRDADLAEAEAIIAARDAEIARFNAREMKVRLELRDGRDEAADLRDRLKATSNACNGAENRLDTMTAVARGNKRHSATLTALLERVTALIVDDAGKPKDPALVLHVGDLRRALEAPLPHEQGGRINSPVDGDHPPAWSSGCVIAPGVFGTKGPITPTLEENAMTETMLDVDQPLPGMPEPTAPATDAEASGPFRLAEWRALPDICFIAACDGNEIDQRGPVWLRDGSMHKACTEHWEPIMRVLGGQATWERTDAARSAV